METTEWKNYGAKSGNPQCANCMVHSGHEASAVDYAFSSLKGFMMTAKKFMFPPVYEDADALKLLNEWPKAQHGPLVQIAAPSNKAAELQEVSGD
jgi:hypothetical protein